MLVGDTFINGIAIAKLREHLIQLIIRDAMVGFFKALHVFVFPIPKAEGQDDEVGGIEGFGIGDALLIVGIDFSLVVDGEEDGAIKAVVFCKDSGHLR